ncbi:Peptidase, S9A/B/C family, catalytic domain protein [Sulfobacillus acidophilus TPY]|uniref:Peptidase S9 prolyl oligopeptidase n=1 Tax=Sulfobacillus acidophilus (strain ATCC 700253 / DSM 10332 / NAL) TaxID=679936 RepID=G8TT92_SULAD|nr:Peptidase, S9A/B/C family, catalytic domain protein [Sulfobacillus acidophilus TPY]AEW04472.1 peptidase S9 prolyl oligopeptidase [Sulfobacillus acidophilus DSM 10332]
MEPATVAPFGTWKSPISAQSLVERAVGLDDVLTDSSGDYWIESRPEENGRSVLMRRTLNGRTEVVTPEPYHVRSRVYEYGGGAATVADGTVYFTDYRTHQVVRLSEGRQPEPLTPEGPYRYGDLHWDAARRRLLAIREDHTAQGHPTHTLVAIDGHSISPGQVLVSGHDFYQAPRVSPDGRRIAWVSWNHPAMPWDASELWLGEWAPDGSIQQPKRIAGGPAESVQQPLWSPDGSLYFISDRTGWWNIYRWTPESGVTPVTALKAEFGVPTWTLGQSTMGLIDSHTLLATYSIKGYSHLVRIDVDTRELTHIRMPFTWIGRLKVGPTAALMIVAADNDVSQVVRFDWHHDRFQTLRRAWERPVMPDYLSRPQPIEFPTSDGTTAHAFYYPPANPHYRAPEGERPPLVLFVHGGPTTQRFPVYQPAIQFWTSRGFAVADVNYGGSTGYGRAYRQRLTGKWGIVDVDDCVFLTRYLVRQGLADERRLAIRGSSAGGYTTLAALTFRKTFHVGASYYGVSDLASLAQETHKFEAHYLDSLVGPWPAAEAEYQARSPLAHTDQCRTPVIFFQGSDDRVVPPPQSAQMVEGLKAQGVPVSYVTFAGEGHGFVDGATIVRATEAELWFYAKIFGIRLADPLPPIPVANLS